ncbi:MAG: Kelch repeat-containing protein, partial [Victivallaceae bacterium]
MTKYIQEKFTAPEVTEAFRHADAVELEKTADGIKLKTGYLGSSKPQAALKPEEVKALKAMAARNNFKEDGLPVFTLGNSLSEGYTIRYKGNALKVRHIVRGGKSSGAVIEDGAVVYSDTYRDTSILYVMSSGRCQEMLLLKSAKAPKQFKYEFSKEVAFNEKGEIIVDGLTLSRPVIFDAAGKRINGLYRKTAKTRIQLAFNSRGLRYPLLIDPTWQASVGSMGSAKNSHTATLLPNGKILVAGGYNGASISLAELYDPATKTFSATGSMSSAREGHSATLLPNGKVLVAGGSGAGILSSAELYDPAAGTFSATGSMSSARTAHTATLLPNGKVLVAGGYNGASISTAELYDPAAGTFSATGSMGAARYAYTATLLPNGKVLVAGGS